MRESRRLTVMFPALTPAYEWIMLTDENKPYKHDRSPCCHLSARMTIPFLPVAAGIDRRANERRRAQPAWFPAEPAASLRRTSANMNPCRRIREIPTAACAAFRQAAESKSCG